MPVDLRNRPVNPAAPPAPRYHVRVEELERMIGNVRITHLGSSGSCASSYGTSHATLHSHHRIARMLPGMFLGMMVLDIALGMAPETATRGRMVRDIGVGPEAYLFPVTYRNSKVDVRSLASCGFSKLSIIFPSLECRKGSM